MKHLSFSGVFMTLVALLCSFTYANADKITLYEGSAHSSVIPISRIYPSSQFIIPSDDLESVNGNNITSLHFIVRSFETDLSYVKNLNIKVYLKEVDYTTMTGFEPLDGSTKVFEGEITFNCTKKQDLAINFSTPFPYSGRNLLVCIEHPKISDIVIIDFNGTSVKGAACSGNTATIYDFIPRTEIYYTAGSAPVYSKPTVTLNKNDSRSFSISWTALNNVTGYIYQYRKQDENWSDPVSTNTTIATLNDLMPATPYDFRVKAIYGQETSAFANKTIITYSERSITTFPWSDNLEALRTGIIQDSCWINGNVGDDSAKQAGITQSNHAGNSTKQLRFPRIPQGESTTVLLPAMILPDSKQCLVFDMYRDNSNPDKNAEGIRVYASKDGKTEGATELAFIPRLYSASNGQIQAESQEGWYTYELPVPIEGDCRIILRSEGQDGNEIVLDNFSVKECPAAFRPTGFSVNDIEGTSALISWFENGTATSWDLCLNNDEENLIEAGANPFTITGLDYNTNYTVKVRARTGTHVSGWSNIIRFTTLPYVPPCLTPQNLTVSYTEGTTATVNWTSSEPRFDIDINGTVIENISKPYQMTGLESATFYDVKVRARNDAGISDWTNTISFHTVFFEEMCSVSLELTDTYGDGWNGNKIRIVDALSGIEIGSFRNHNLKANVADKYNASVPIGREIQFVFVKGSSPTECIWVVKDMNEEVLFSGRGSNDMNTGDILFTYTADGIANPWRRPSDLKTSEVGLDYIKLDWTERSIVPASSWVVAYKKENDQDYSYADASHKPFVLTRLKPDTRYTVKVRPVSDEGSIRWSDNISFNTLSYESSPMRLKTDRITKNAARLSWDGVQDNYNLRYKYIADDTILFHEDWSKCREVYRDSEKRIFVSDSVLLYLYGGTEDSKPYENAFALQTIQSCTQTLQINYPLSKGDRLRFTFNGMQNSYNNMRIGYITTKGQNVLYDIVYSLYNENDNNLYEVAMPEDVNAIYIAYEVSDYGVLGIYDLFFLNPYKESSWTTVNNIQSPYLLSSLKTDAQYEWQVQGNLANGTTDWISNKFRTARELTLNENDGVTGLVKNAGKDVYAYFSRSFTQGVASTVCLPFAMNSVTGGTLYDFADVTYDDKDGWVATMKETNLAAAPTVAGRPYLFMPSVTGDVTFEGMIYDVPNSFTAGETTSAHTGGGTWTFHGTYTDISWNVGMGTFYGFAANTYNTQNYAVKPGDFVRAANGASVPPFRCYLTYNDSGMMAPGRGVTDVPGTMPDRIKVRLLGADGTVTAVGLIETATGHIVIDKWFDMNGRELPERPTTSGTYIYGGKTVVIND